METKTNTSPRMGPGYYKRGSIEVWDFIRDQDLNYHLGNAVKYICRAGYKDDREADLNKAIHYLTNELEHNEPTTTSQSFSYRFPGEEQYNAGFTG